jgi:hypothetical protein
LYHSDDTVKDDDLLEGMFWSPSMEDVSLEGDGNVNTHSIWEHEIVERRSTEILVIFTIFYQKCTIVNTRLD